MPRGAQGQQQGPRNGLVGMENDLPKARRCESQIIVLRGCATDATGVYLLRTIEHTSDLQRFVRIL